MTLVLCASVLATVAFVLVGPRTATADPSAGVTTSTYGPRESGSTALEEGSTTTIAPSSDGNGAATTVVASAATSSSGLAFTGADVTGTVVVGAAALGVGGALVLASRRRRQNRQD